MSTEPANKKPPIKSKYVTKTDLENGDVLVLGDIARAKVKLFQIVLAGMPDSQGVPV